MTDEYICKQAAIDAFGLSEKTRKYGGDHSGYDTRMLYEIQDTIESLKPADVAPVVHSQWVLGGYDDMYYVCERCGHKQSEYYHKPTAKYCPNCGAKMNRQE